MFSPNLRRVLSLALLIALVTAGAHAAAGGAAIATSPTAGSVGTIFELNGTGVPALSNGSITIDGIDLGQISSDETGAIRGFFMVPQMHTGPAKVRVVFDKTRAQTTFTVTAG